MVRSGVRAIEPMRRILGQASRRVADIARKRKAKLAAQSESEVSLDDRRGRKILKARLP